MARIVNGDRRGRAGRWLVDYREPTGRRRVLTFPTRRDAEDKLAEIVKESRQPLRPTVNPRITLSDYAQDEWLPHVSVTTKPRTVESYTALLRLHVEPAFGPVPLRNITRPQLKKFFSGLLAHRAPKTVQLVLAVTRTLYSAAIEDGLIASNPCAGLGRVLKLGALHGGEQVKALDAGQVEAFLQAIRTAPRASDRRLLPLFMMLARAGLRIGEALGLRWPDVDLPGRQLLIRRQRSRGVEGTTKSGRERFVSASFELIAALRHHETTLKAEKLSHGWMNLPEWVFVNAAGKPADENKVREAMTRALKRAGLPSYFSPHSLRHSFGSLLASQGEPPQYIADQMGHQSVALTMRVYARWFPMRPSHGGVDGLDSPQDGIKRYPAAAASAWSGPSQPLDFAGNLPNAPPVGLLTTSSVKPNPAAFSRTKPHEKSVDHEGPSCLLRALVCPGSSWLW